ncbi:MAG TPA: hypothetical protein VKH19_07525 [Gemmatimonadaceae bacterium]|nr:hypothetical protein [Gemmatimonadaceae bacterium]
MAWRNVIRHVVNALGNAVIWLVRHVAALMTLARRLRRRKTAQ